MVPIVVLSRRCPLPNNRLISLSITGQPQMATAETEVASPRFVAGPQIVRVRHQTCTATPFEPMALVSRPLLTQFVIVISAAEGQVEWAPPT